MYSYSETNSYEAILTRLLDRVDDSFDKREGSIIYDALAPAAAELADCYIALDIYQNQTYLKTASGENLDNRVVDYGMERIQATPSQVVIQVKDTSDDLMTIDIGTRFAVPNEYGGYNYEVIENISTGNYIAQCETLGTVGNRYIGEVLPLQSINNLGSAEIISIYQLAEDTETDSELRDRALRKINQESFAGNKAAYREMAIGINGVADCKVYPVWNGGGTVKLAILGPNHTIPPQSVVDNVQTDIDPLVNQGQGIGLAPIGHQVTVVAPTAVTLPISATLTLNNVTISDIQTEVENQLAAYFYEIQNDFVNKDKLIIYISKVSAAILNVNGIENVTNVRINNVVSDYEIDNSAGTTINYPFLGTVTLS